MLLYLAIARFYENGKSRNANYYDTPKKEFSTILAHNEGKFDVRKLIHPNFEFNAIFHESEKKGRNTITCVSIILSGETLSREKKGFAFTSPSFDGALNNVPLCSFLLHFVFFEARWLADDNHDDDADDNQLRQQQLRALHRRCKSEPGLIYTLDDTADHPPIFSHLYFLYIERAYREEKENSFLISIYWDEKTYSIQRCPKIAT